MTVDLFCMVYKQHEGTISLIPYETLLNVLRRSTLAVAAKDDSSFGPTPTLNRDVSTGIARLLSDGLNVGPLPQDRATLIEQCLLDLKENHPGAIWSLQVVQGIFGMSQWVLTATLSFPSPFHYCLANRILLVQFLQST